MPPSPQPDAAGRRSLLLPLALLVAVIVTLTAGNVMHTISHLEESEEVRLQAIADLKADQVAGWLHDRRGDAQILSGNLHLSELYRNWRIQYDAASGDRLLQRLEDYRRAYDYSEVLIFDASGALVWPTTAPDAQPTPELLAAVRSVHTKAPTLHLGPYRAPSGRVLLDNVIALPPVEGQPGPVVVLRSDPTLKIFPLLQSWPSRTDTGEVLLFRRDGDQVQVLNEARLQADTALRLRAPMKGKGLIGPMVLKGEAKAGKVVEGLDYRRIPVVGVVRTIAGTDWFLVAKMDRAEFYGEATKDALLIILAGLLALAVTGVGARLYRQRQRLAFAESERRAQEDRLAMREQFEKVAGSVPGMIFSFRMRPDGSSCMPYASPAITDVIGLLLEEVVDDAATAFALVLADDLDGLHASIAASARDLTPWHLEWRFHHPEKGERWLEGQAMPLREPDGGTLWHGYMQDITARRQAEEQQRIAAVAFDSRDGMMVTDRKGVILRVNRAFSEFTGYSAEEAVGNTPALLHSTRHDDAFYRKMWEAISREGHWEGEIWNRRKDGGIYPEWLAISAIRDEAGEITHYLGTFSDISEPREAQRKILELAYYDSLTDLPNRRLLLDRLQQAMSASARNYLFGALFLLDLDHFKTLNDTRGHDIGDQLLVQVAQRLQGVVREGDTVARLGGDEFVVLLESLGENEVQAAAHAEHIAEKIRSSLNREYPLGDQDSHVSPSIGVTLFYGHAESLDELLKHADLALYQAKGAGRNAIRFFNPAMQAAIDARARLEACLRLALVKEEFVLHYQPQVDSDGGIVGAEVLLRWQPEGVEMVPPAEFIPLAEETGLILPIGRWVLETACRRLADWSRDPATQHLQLAVNISARQFRQADFAEQVRDLLERTGANPRRLKLELTESLVLDSVDHTIQTMHELKALGVGFSLDDFGTGYSSLSQLKRLPLEQLKIDQSFVHDLDTTPDATAIAQAIISLAHNLRLEVIAEGVETEVQRRFLAEHGCLTYQGWLFGRPCPAAELEARLRG